jgi:DNA damage-binding protein 1
MAGHRAPLTALTISTLPPFILMGDLMKSITLLRLDSSSGRTELTTLARDYAPLWMTSVAMIEEGWFLGAEDSGNIIGWKRDDNLTPDEARLNMVHEMRFGEMINRIRPGISCLGVFADGRFSE